MTSGQPKENFTISAESRKRASSNKLISADIISAETVHFYRKSLFLQKGVTVCRKADMGGHSFCFLQKLSAEILQKYSFGWPLIFPTPANASSGWRKAIELRGYWTMRLKEPRVNTPTEPVAEAVCVLSCRKISNRLAGYMVCHAFLYGTYCIYCTDHAT